MKNNLVLYRIRFVVYYYIEYDKLSYDYYINTLNKITSENTSDEEKKEIIKKYSPYVKIDSLIDIIYNTLMFMSIYGKKLFLFFRKLNQKIVVYINQNKYKIKNKTVKKTVNKISEHIDYDKKSTKKDQHDDIKDSHGNYVEINTWTISNFDKNFLLLVSMYPHLKQKWKGDQRKFLRVYRVYSIIYENIQYPANRLSNNIVFYKEI